MSTNWRATALSASIIGTGVIAIAVVSGVCYEQVQRARDREQFPPIGRPVYIGGRMLNIYCSGAGQPAVILESGSDWAFYENPKEIFENASPRPGYSWVRIQRELAKFTAACWYDPAGSGWSDLGPYPRDSASQARDLHSLLQGAGVPPPYVLVAESSAALDAHVYAGFYPADVAGLVFVNGVHPDLLLRTRPGSKKLAWMPGFVGYFQDVEAQVINRIGLFRLGLPNRPAPAPTPQGMTPSEWNTIWRLTRSSKARSALLQDIASWPQSAAEARTAGSLGDRPLIVLSPENTDLASGYSGMRMDLQTDLARLSARGKLMMAGHNSDALVYQAPGAIIDAARQVLDDLRHRP